MTDPVSITLITLRAILPVASAVCNAVDKALELERREKQALNDLYKAIKNLKSDIEGYAILLNAMDRDGDRNPSSPYMRFIQR